jgi:chromosome segregation ATPase
MYGDDRRGRPSQFGAEARQPLGDEAPLRAAAAHGLGLGLGPPAQRPHPTWDLPPARVPQPEPADAGDLRERVRQLEGALQKVVAFDLPMKLKPYDDALSNLQSKFEISGHTNRDLFQSFREKLTEVSFSVNGFSQKMNDHTDRTRSAISEVKADTAKNHEICESIVNRASQHDSRLASIEQNIRAISQRQQSLEQSITEQFSQIAAILTQLQRNATAANGHIMSQLELANRETVATFGRMKESIDANAAVVNDAISGLAKETRDSFAIVRQEAEEDLPVLRQQIESTNSAVSKVLSAFQSEVIETFSSFRSAMDSNVRVLHQSLEEEISVRQEHDRQLTEASKALSSHLSGQISRLEASIQPRVEQVCESHAVKWKHELAICLRDAAESVSECKQRVLTMEEKIGGFHKHNEAIDQTIAELDRSLRLQMSGLGQAMRTDVSGLKRQVDLMGEDLQRTVKHQVESTAVKIAQIDSRIEQMKEQLSEKLEGARLKNDELMPRLRQLESRTQELVSKSDNTSRQLQQLETRVQESLSKAEDKNHGVQQLEIRTDQRIEQLEARTGELASQAESASQQLKKLFRRMDDLASAAFGDLQNLNGRLDDLHTHSQPDAELHTRVAELEGKMAEDEGKVAELEGKVAEDEGKVAALEQKVAELEKVPSPLLKVGDNCTEASARLILIEQDAASLAARVSSIEGQIPDMNTQIERKMDRDEFELRVAQLQPSLDEPQPPAPVDPDPLPVIDSRPPGFDPQLPYDPQLMLGVEDIEVPDPPQGDFHLCIAEPRPNPQPGLYIALPRVFNEYVYPGRGGPDGEPRMPVEAYRASARFARSRARGRGGARRGARR